MTNLKQKELPLKYALLKKHIELDLRHYDEYIDEISVNIEHEKLKISKEYDEINKQEPESDFLGVLEDDYWKYNEVFTKLAFNPLLLSIYGLFENWLKKLCDIEHQRGFSNITVSDLAGRNYIEKSKIYFIKVSGIQFPENDIMWDKIKRIQQIRNLIAHNEANIIKNKNKLVTEQSSFQIIKKELHIKLDEKNGDFYISNKQFITDTIKLFKEYLFYIIDKISIIKVVAKNSSLPYDMTMWGEEKTETLLKEVITGLQMIDGCFERKDEYRYTDTIHNLKGHFESMTWDLTKLYSFFTGGNWDTEDRSLIITERNIGLNKLKKKYL